MPRSAARRQERRKLSDERTSGAVAAPYPGFIEPCHATQRDSVPKQGSWLHEIKHDGSPYSGRISWLETVDANPWPAVADAVDYGLQNPC